MRRTALAFLMFLLCISPVFAQAPVLFVDAGEVLGEINPFTRGVNYNTFSAVPFDLLPQAEASGLTYMRFPAGRVSDQAYLSPFKVDEYIALARRMNVEPNINVRLENGTPEKAAELLQYTIDQGYNVRYWSIGNEPNLFERYGNTGYTTERYNVEWRAIAEAMLAVDPDIILVGPDISQYPGILSQNPKDSTGRDWMEEFLKANGDLVDIVSIHRYPFPLGTQRVTTIEDLRTNPHEWDHIIPALREVMRDILGDVKPIAVTEINSHWSAAIFGEASPDSFYNAIWLGDVLGRIIRQQVAIIAYFDLQSADSRGGWGLLARYNVRPSYYVYQIYQHFGTQLIHTSSTDADVSVYGALREDGALTLIVVNLGPEARTVPLLLHNFTPSAPAELWLFDAEYKAENVGVVDLSDQLSVPAQSISLYIVP